MVSFLFNVVASFAADLYGSFMAFLAVFLTLAWLSWCIRCANCGHSPFVRRRGSLRIGTAIPELKCSGCGRDYRIERPRQQSDDTSSAGKTHPSAS